MPVAQVVVQQVAPIRAVRTAKTQTVQAPEHAGGGTQVRRARATTVLYMIRTHPISGALDSAVTLTIAETQAPAAEVTQVVELARTSAEAMTEVTVVVGAHTSNLVLRWRQMLRNGEVQVPPPEVGFTMGTTCTPTFLATVNWCCHTRQQPARFRSSRQMGWLV